MNKAHFYTALIALGAFAACAFIQSKVVEIPVVGKFLPNA